MRNIFLKDQVHAMLQVLCGSSWNQNISQAVATDYLTTIDDVSFANAAIKYKENPDVGIDYKLYERELFRDFYAKHRKDILAWLGRCADASNHESHIEYITALVNADNSNFQVSVFDISVIVNGQTMWHEYHREVVHSIMKAVVINMMNVFNKACDAANYQELSDELSSYLYFKVNDESNLKIRMPLIKRIISALGVQEVHDIAMSNSSKDSISLDAVEFYTDNREIVLEWLTGYTESKNKGNIIEFTQQLMLDNNIKTNLDSISLTIHADDFNCEQYDNIIEHIVFHLMYVVLADMQDFVNTHYQAVLARRAARRAAKN